MFLLLFVTGRQHQAKEFERLLSKVRQQGLLQFFEMVPLDTQSGDPGFRAIQGSDMEREKGLERWILLDRERIFKMLWGWRMVRTRWCHLKRSCTSSCPFLVTSHIILFKWDEILWFHLTVSMASGICLYELHLASTRAVGGKVLIPKSFWDESEQNETCPLDAFGLLPHAAFQWPKPADSSPHLPPCKLETRDERKVQNDALLATNISNNPVYVARAILSTCTWKKRKAPCVKEQKLDQHESTWINGFVDVPISFSLRIKSPCPEASREDYALTRPVACHLWPKGSMAWPGIHMAQHRFGTLGIHMDPQSLENNHRAIGVGWFWRRQVISFARLEGSTHVLFISFEVAGSCRSMIFSFGGRPHQW